MQNYIVENMIKQVSATKPLLYGILKNKYYSSSCLNEKCFSQDDRSAQTDVLDQARINSILNWNLSAECFLQ